MMTYTSLKERPKEFLAVTSLTLEEFVLLLPVFSDWYHSPLTEKTATGQRRKRRPGAGVKGKLDTIEDKLLLILAYQKTYPLQTLLGLHFGLGQPQTHYWIHRLLPVLQKALKQMGHTPERDPAKVASSLGCDPGVSDLVIDGTERRRQRPKDPLSQKEHYSGKKKSIPTRTCSWGIVRGAKWSTWAKRFPARFTTKSRPIRSRLSIRRALFSRKIPVFRAMLPKA